MNKNISEVSSTMNIHTIGSSAEPPDGSRRGNTWLTPFWHDRLVEGGLILSLALYYVIGNQNIHIGHFSFAPSLFAHPLYTLPFLLVYALLCWYRLPFAVALLPLFLPYYAQQKNVYAHYAFSLAEITLATCVAVALLQLAVRRKRWRYWLSSRELAARFGPFAVPMLLFFVMAAFSILVAFNKTVALRAFREEVLDPFAYVLLLFACVRTRQDMRRLLAALLGAGVIIALLGLAQMLLFKNTLKLEDGVRRIYAVYGSANSIGLLFDYVLPIGFALLLARVSGRVRLLAVGCCIPMLVALYLTQSLGAWVALTFALLFVAAFSVRNRSVRLVGSGIFIALLLIGSFLFRTQITNVFVDHHVSAKSPGVHTVSTVTKRIYLWQSALHMIHDSPWFGYGMDNWLCYYSSNKYCDAHKQYWIQVDPVTHKDTGLKFEPDLSHPHNIFLHVWVSIGIFGLLAFGAVIVLFFWLFLRIMWRLSGNAALGREGAETLRWMVLGTGAAMLAALVQGLVDSAFLEQDLAFCFWTIVAALLLLRVQAGVAWRGKRDIAEQPTTPLGMLR